MSVDAWVHTRFEEEKSDAHHQQVFHECPELGMYRRMRMKKACMDKVCMNEEGVHERGVHTRVDQELSTMFNDACC